MEFDQYREYSTVFDFFSNPDFFPVLAWFVTDVIAPNLKPNARVTDVGAGTGLFSQLLLEHVPSAQLTLIEPASEMLAIARQRLGSRVRYINEPIDVAMASLPKQDAFIFQRSLYVIFQNEKHATKLFYHLNKKLQIGGKVFIQDVPRKYNLDEMKAYLLEQVSHSSQATDQLLSRYPAFEAALKLFNQQVDQGNFQIFTPDKLNSLMANAGFSSFVQPEEAIYVYQKIMACRLPFWLHQIMVSI